MRNKILYLDPDNVFWALASNADESVYRRIRHFYDKNRNELTARINDFRTSQDLTAIYINPTDRCNAACFYCYIPAEFRQNGRSMTTEELELILGKIAKHFGKRKKKQVIIFHASEPLLVKEIIFDAIKKYNRCFKFGLQTNAILLKKKDVRFLMKYHVGVGISLDSHLPSTNNRLRSSGVNRGNFSYAVRAIEWFNGYSGLNVITTVNKQNVKHLPGLVKFLHKKKVPCVLMNPLRFTQPASRSLKPDEKLLAASFIKAIETAMELSSASKHKIIIGNFANTILAIIAPEARRLMCDISPCGGGRCFFAITAAGEMIPCGEFIGLKGFSGGNIFKHSISKAMRSEAFRKIRARYVEKIPECKDCGLRNICGAPCPAELHSLGNMYQKSEFCNFYKEIIGYAFKLIAEDKVKYLLRDGSSMNLKFAYNFKIKKE